MEEYQKIKSKRYQNLVLKVIPGHFVTANSHINYYIDMTTMKARQSEASAAAKALAEKYLVTSIVDTIVCMDGCEVIGAYLAQELSAAGILSMNAHKTIYITHPEFDSSGLIIFRENNMQMIHGKNVLVLLASATTGKTVHRAIDSILYYGGTVTGISAIFSAATEIAGFPIHALFTTDDVPDYQDYKHDNCLLCKNKQPIDAIANGFGYSRI